jgi:hypothetical protein
MRINEDFLDSIDASQDVQHSCPTQYKKEEPCFSARLS